MKSTALLLSLIVSLLALPVQAKDRDKLGTWSLEELCEKKDKSRHADAVFAEFERRGSFTAFELELIREGRIDIGIGEAALHCSWGLPRGTEAWNGEPWLVYYRRRDGLSWRMLLRIDSSLVAEIRPDFGAGPTDGSRSLSTGGLGVEDQTLSGRIIYPDGRLSDPGGYSNPYDIGRSAGMSEAERASQRP